MYAEPDPHLRRRQSNDPSVRKGDEAQSQATFGSGGGTKERVIKSESFDVPIVQLPLEPVVASGIS